MRSPDAPKAGEERAFEPLKKTEKAVRNVQRQLELSRRHVTILVNTDVSMLNDAPEVTPVAADCGSQRLGLPWILEVIATV
jgi:hypothetical protein